MADSPLLLNFQAAYRNLRLEPLLKPEDLRRFRVDYGREVLEELEQLLEDDPTQSGKIIVSGHRGCGKSTLLSEFGRLCESRNYFVVFFSIAEAIEMSDVDHVNILFAIAVNLMFEAEQQGLDIPEEVQKRFHQWFASKTRIETDAPLSAEVSVRFNLFEMVKGKLKSEASIREELKQEFKRNISDLVSTINVMAAQIQAVSTKQVLVIIDDLDKLDLEVVEDIYKNNIKALFQPAFPIIFTTPVASLRKASLNAMMATETNDQIAVMSVTKLFPRETKRNETAIPNSDAVETLCEVLHRRIPVALLSPEVTEQIVLRSGGVLRELIRLSNECCRICLRQIRRNRDLESLTITPEIVDEATKKLRLGFEILLGEKEYTILKETYEAFTPRDPKAQTFLDLLHELHVLEYRNGAVWYDLHPIVVELLERWEDSHAE